MNLIREPYIFTKDKIEIIEKARDARWLLDTEHNGIPVSVFWTDVKHPAGSNFFALYYTTTKESPNKQVLMITNGDFILDQKITGLLLPNGGQVSKGNEPASQADYVIYSRHRHDMFWHGDVAIDGGREYTRVVGNVNYPRVTITFNGRGEILIT